MKSIKNFGLATVVTGILIGCTACGDSPKVSISKGMNPNSIYIKGECVIETDSGRAYLGNMWMFDNDKDGTIDEILSTTGPARFLHPNEIARELEYEKKGSRFPFRVRHFLAKGSVAYINLPTPPEEMKEDMRNAWTKTYMSLVVGTY